MFTIVCPIFGHKDIKKAWPKLGFWIMISAKSLDPSANLKGHGNEVDFLGFLHKSIRQRSLTLHFEMFRFNIDFTEIFAIEKRLNKIAYRYNFFQTFK
jgi:hypothetical protein